MNLYRGKKNSFPLGRFPNEFLSRDRRPRDLHPRTHEFADGWFLDKFGVRARSQSLMCTTNPLQAHTYGEVVRIIEPLPPYKLIASDEVDDFLDIYRSVLRDADQIEIEEWLAIHEYYCVDHLSLLSEDSRGEVMVFCEQYEVKIAPGYATIR